MQLAHSDAHIRLLERFKTFYHDLTSVPLEDIDQLYSSDVIFRDPVHEIRGLDCLHTYMESLCMDLSAGRFEFLDQMAIPGSAYVKWNMHFSHPRLGGQSIVVRGMSQIQFDDTIFYHEDVYDMGQMLYEHVPVLGWATAWLKRRIARQSKS